MKLLPEQQLKFGEEVESLPTSSIVSAALTLGATQNKQKRFQRK